jgi:DNA-binding response OmpR family regulator
MTRIAWIEDDYEEISSLVRLLELEGIKIPKYRKLQEVEKNIEDIIACDAIILDIILPPVTDDDPHDGISVLKMLREKYKYDKPVVVCSIVRAPGAMDALRKLGVKDENILHKPVRPSILTKVVKKALRLLDEE